MTENKILFVTNISKSELTASLIKIFNGSFYEGDDFVDVATKAIIAGECSFVVAVTKMGCDSFLWFNKFKGVVCGYCCESVSAKLTRLHNDANVLALSEKKTGLEVAKNIVEVFIETVVDKNERYAKRRRMLE